MPTADGNINGTIRFGNRGYMNERTASKGLVPGGRSALPGFSVG